MAVATTITQTPVTMTYENTYPSKMGTTTSTVVVTLTTTIVIPPLVTNLIQVSNFRWTGSTDAFYVTSSVIFPPLVVSESPRATTEGDNSIHTIPGYVYMYQPGPYPPNRDPSDPKYTPIPPPPPPGKPPKIHIKNRITRCKMPTWSGLWIALFTKLHSRTTLCWTLWLPWTLLRWGWWRVKRFQ
jgi:hypothetical protein